VNVAVAGDPASCSLVGGALRQLAARLRTTGKRAHDAFDHRGRDRPGAVETRSRRRVDAVDAAAATAARELDRVGAALQAHATDLAEAIATSRQVTARAEAAGLQLTDGRFTPAWGVAGLADPGVSREQASALESLQRELDQVSSVLRQRRQRLSGTLAESRASLAGHAAALRR
jgi:hypothetical protein